MNSELSITAKKNFFTYYLSSAGCLYVSIYVCQCDCSHTVQSTASKLWHNIYHGTVYKWASQIFEKMFFAELFPFSIFLSDFSVNLKTNYAKTREGRIEFFVHKSRGAIQKFTGFFFAQKRPGFLLCLFDFQIVQPGKNSHQNFVITK